MFRFKYGCVKSAKSMNLLAARDGFVRQNKKVILITPDIDTRYGYGVVGSRVGLKVKADIVIKHKGDGEELNDIDLKTTYCVMVDEAQFLSEAIIYKLEKIAHSIPVHCYGLRTDFMKGLFPGSEALLRLADTIEEIEITCCQCERRAVFNMKGEESEEGVEKKEEEKNKETSVATISDISRLPIESGKPELTQIQIGNNFQPVCSIHYREPKLDMKN